MTVALPDPALATKSVPTYGRTSPGREPRSRPLPEALSPTCFAGSGRPPLPHCPGLSGVGTETPPPVPSIPRRTGTTGPPASSVPFVRVRPAPETGSLRPCPAPRTPSPSCSAPLSSSGAVTTFPTLCRFVYILRSSYFRTAISAVFTATSSVPITAPGARSMPEWTPAPRHTSDDCHHCAVKELLSGNRHDNLERGHTAVSWAWGQRPTCEMRDSQREGRRPGCPRFAKSSETSHPGGLARARSVSRTEGWAGASPGGSSGPWELHVAVATCQLPPPLLGADGPIVPAP
ncbi:extensin-like [Pteropus medius]|uniref:extensin-like n=1 Tax=Pteropus vampyrus TaxID=132908 RepID=UPI00196A6F5B|nr:extensin-like [Pteropus giganteus]XP_039718490.1 extensin-like [Pteropus giganteus]